MDDIPAIMLQKQKIRSKEQLNSYYKVFFFLLSLLLDNCDS